MSTIQDREDIGGNRYLVTPMAHIAGYRIDIMMAEYFQTLGLSQYRFLCEADTLHGDLGTNGLDYSPFLLHWIRIIDTANGRSYCLNRLEAQSFGLLFGMCGQVGGDLGLLRDLIALGLEIGSFSGVVHHHGGRMAELADSQYHTARNTGERRMMEQPWHRVGMATYACIPQPAIRNARADYCVLTGFDHDAFRLDWSNLPAVRPKNWSLQPSEDRYFWLRFIDCGTGTAYCLSGPEADAFIMFRHRHCWGKSIHCVFDMDILVNPYWSDNPDQFELAECLAQGSFQDYFAIRAHLETR